MKALFYGEENFTSTVEMMTVFVEKLHRISWFFVMREEKTCYAPKNPKRHKGTACGSHRWADGTCCGMVEHSDDVPGTQRRLPCAEV